MMDCETLKRKFEPAAQVTAAMQRHLQHCQSCQCYVRELTQLRSLLLADPPVSVPEDFNLQLQQRLEHLRRNPFAWWRWADIRYALPIAAMLLLGVGTLALLNQRTHSPDVRHTSVEAVAARPTIGSEQSVRTEPPVFLSADVASSPPAVRPTPLMGTGRELVSVRTIHVGRQHLFSDGSQILLRLRDDRREHEKLLAIPSLVVGAESLFVSTRPTAGESEHVY